MRDKPLVEVDAGLSYVMPQTTYFEIDSAEVGDRFAVWVTVPMCYEDDGASYPFWCSRTTETSWHQ